MHPAGSAPQIGRGFCLRSTLSDRPLPFGTPSESMKKGVGQKHRTTWVETTLTAGAAE
jgi:hypothetical protein